MAVEILQFPIAAVPSGGNSLWNAVHNPILFKFQREDLEIDHIEIGSGTETQADIYPDDDSDPLFLAMQSGDKIYVSNSYITGLFTVILADSVKARISLPSGYVAGTYNNGWFNLNTQIENYRFEVKIGLVVADVFTPFITTEWVPDPTGLIEVDVAAYLKPYLPLVNEFQYDVLNEKDTNLSNQFSVSVRQVWTGYTSEEFGALGTYYFTNSAKQIGDLYGGNMGEFVLFTGVSNAKFLSGFVQPHYWVGYPFDIAFINSLDSGTYPLERRTIAKDINGEGAVALDSNIELAEFPYINRLTFSDLVNDSYYLDFRLQLAAGNVALTELKRIRLENDCLQQPVYLCWKNKNGGWDYWMFQWNQKRKRTTGDLQTFEAYITDFAAATSRIKVSSKTAVPSMVLGASLVAKDDMYYNEQFPGLTGLLDSPEVLMLSNPATWDYDGPVWITVTPKTGVFNIIETRLTSSDIELEIVLPYIQIEKQ